MRDRPPPAQDGTLACVDEDPRLRADDAPARPVPALCQTRRLAPKDRLQRLGSQPAPAMARVFLGSLRERLTKRWLRRVRRSTYASGAWVSRLSTRTNWSPCGVRNVQCPAHASRAIIRPWLREASQRFSGSSPHGPSVQCSRTRSVCPFGSWQSWRVLLRSWWRLIPVA